VAGLGAAAGALVAAVGTARFLTAVWATLVEFAGLDIGAQFFQMIENLGGGFAGK
jgi:hypothetical protein